MDGNQTILDPPDNSGASSSKATEKKPMHFSFGAWALGDELGIVDARQVVLVCWTAG
jgi:hypothetical protein